MFIYSNLSIDSAIPIQEILDYFAEIGAERSPNDTYLFNGLEFEVISYESEISPSFSIPRHNITVLTGNRTAAENFLTNFRLRFLSAGG